MELQNRKHDERPWGSFDQFTLNEASTVKILRIKESEMFSLQFHHHRTEFWYVISGTGTVIIDGKEHEAVTGDEFFIDKEMRHRIIGGIGGIEVLEISMGEFDEDDIERLEDKYGRT